MKGRWKICFIEIIPFVISCSIDARNVLKNENLENFKYASLINILSCFVYLRHFDSRKVGGSGVFSIFILIMYIELLLYIDCYKFNHCEVIFTYITQNRISVSVMSIRWSYLFIYYYCFSLIPIILNISEVHYSMFFPQRFNILFSSFMCSNWHNTLVTHSVTCYWSHC